MRDAFQRLAPVRPSLYIPLRIRSTSSRSNSMVVMGGEDRVPSESHENSISITHFTLNSQPAAVHFCVDVYGPCSAGDLGLFHDADSCSYCRPASCTILVTSAGSHLVYSVLQVLWNVPGTPIV